MLNPKLKSPDLSGKVAIVTGATRGIGRECALALARCGAAVVIAAKSVSEQKDLPGTIYSVAKEIETFGGRSLPCQLDLRDHKSIERCVESTVAAFGRVDILVNNASALWWQLIENTPINKYDLITSINVRGTFYITKLCMQHMKKNRFGRIVCMSPPIQTGYQAYGGFTAYNISKFGMTMCAMGAAAEGAADNITAASLWPATVIESYASINFQLGERRNWRKLIDDVYLMDRFGLTLDDMACYRCDPSVEPPRALAQNIEDTGSFVVRRGDVKELGADHSKTKARL